MTRADIWSLSSLVSSEQCWVPCWTSPRLPGLWWCWWTPWTSGKGRTMAAGGPAPSRSSWPPISSFCPAGCCWSAPSAATTRPCARCSQVGRGTRPAWDVALIHWLSLFYDDRLHAANRQLFSNYFTHIQCNRRMKRLFFSFPLRSINHTLFVTGFKYAALFYPALTFPRFYSIRGSTSLYLPFVLSTLTNISIQFNSVYSYSPFSQIRNLPLSALQSVHIDIPDLWPHIGSGETPKQPFRGRTEEDPSPGWTEQQMSCDQKESLHTN